MQHDQREEDIEQLNSLLRGELSAVETYGQAIEKLKDEPALSTELAACRQSHEQRSHALRAEVQRLGGTPSDSSGPWGAFARLVEGGAKVMGKKAAIAVLEEGEDHGLREYTDKRSDMNAPVAAFVVRELLPAQQRTHDVVSRLQQTV